MDGYRAKVYRAEIKAIDEDAGSVDAVVSTGSVDREGDVIRADGWDLENFNRHPILLSSHNYMSLRSQIGEWDNVRVEGNALRGTARYYIGRGNEEADWGFELARRGKAAYSVGLIPLDAKPLGKGEGWDITRAELLEVSQVTVPANAEALQQMSRTKNLDPVLRSIVDEMAEGTHLACYVPGCEHEGEVRTRICQEHYERLMPHEEPDYDAIRQAIEAGLMQATQETFA